MDPMNLASVTGRILSVTTIGNRCEGQRISMNSNGGPVNFDINASTYVVDHTQLRPGMTVTAFYDSMRPVPLIFPPQYQAVAVTPLRGNETVVIRFFDSSLTASDNSLRLNLAPSTRVVTSNGQRYTCSPANHTLMVYYDRTTRSIPPQTTPRQIIVF